MTGRRLALIVANDTYTNEGLRALRSPAADAEALKRVLGDPRIGGFDDVTVLHNEPAHEISARIEDFFADRRRDDVLLLHFSCHGLKDESNALYFAAANTRPDRLMGSAVPSDLVDKCMRNSRAGGVVLLLDCCYGGAYARGKRPRAGGDAGVLEKFKGGGRGRAVITASGAVEYAFDGEQLAEDNAAQPSIFTAALVEGLATGDADRDEDGTVTVDELYDYLYERVRERSPQQTPERSVEMHGDLWIARSSRMRVKPQPIPEELRVALGDPNRYGRIGAVEELRTRLLSDNLPVAAGAAEALTEIEAHDVEEVANRARTALTQALPRVDATEIRLGPGDDTRVVTVTGPAIARAVSVETTEGWIEVTREDGNLTVASTAKHAGEGLITLSGAAGAVTIRVLAAGGKEPRPAAPPRPRPVAAPSAVAVPPTGSVWAIWVERAVTLLAALSVVSTMTPLLTSDIRVLNQSWHLGAITLLWVGMAVLSRGPRRWWFAAAAAFVLGAAALLLTDPQAALLYISLEHSAVYLFWPCLGLLLAAATASDDDPRTVWLERAAAAQALGLGLLFYLFTDDKQTLTGPYGFEAIWAATGAAVGLTWTVAAVVRLLPRAPSEGP